MCLESEHAVHAAIKRIEAAKRAEARATERRRKKARSTGRWLTLTPRTGATIAGAGVVVAAAVAVLWRWLH